MGIPGRYSTVAVGGITSLLSFLLFLAGVYVPLLGTVLSLFSAVPLFFSFLYGGRKSGLIGVGVVTIGVVLLAGIERGGLFVIEYGLTALVLTETLRRGWPPEPSILTAAGMSLGLGILLLLFYFSAQQAKPMTVLREELRESVTQMSSFYQAQEQAEAQVQEYLERIIDIFVYLFPALVIIGALINTTLTYLVGRSAWEKWGTESRFPPFTLAHWSLPDYFIWSLIATGFFSFLPLASLRFLARNLLLVVLFCYLLQGLVIVHFYFEKTRIPLLLRIVGYLLLIVQPVFLFVVTGLGVFDLWVNFRRIQPKAI